jgi:hypothetical protein
VLLSVADAERELRFRAPIQRDAGGRFALELALAPGEYEARATTIDGGDAQARFDVAETASAPQAVVLAIR